MKDASSKQQTKQKYRHNYQQTGLPPQSASPISVKNKQRNISTNLTLYKAHTDHWTNLRRAETKMKKELNLLQGKNSTFLEAWEKETSNTITFKKRKKENEKAEKYYTNEGKN